MHRDKTYFFVVTLLLLGFVFSASAQNIDLSQKLAVDPNVITGEFDNGLKYVIRVNEKPENRAEVRLTINAGSILEDDDQQGLAARRAQFVACAASRKSAKSQFEFNRDQALVLSAVTDAASTADRTRTCNSSRSSTTPSASAGSTGPSGAGCCRRSRPTPSCSRPGVSTK